MRFPLLLVTLPKVALVGVALAPPQLEWVDDVEDLGP
jgi:hypothetical protein